jgi:hypothetical protein
MSELLAEPTDAFYQTDSGHISRRTAQATEERDRSVEPQRNHEEPGRRGYWSCGWRRRSQTSARPP